MASRFPTTQWSVVLAARGEAGTEANDALAALCRAYWFSTYAFIRRHGHDADAARDLTQEFFTELLAGRLLQPVDRSKGRFRAFLLASLENFLSHQREKARALKRGGGTVTISLDERDAEGRYRREPVERLTPEQVFERRWGLTVMERAMERLEAESGQPATHFERLRRHLTGVEPHQSYRETAAELGISEGALKTAVHRLRRDYGRLLRAEIAETLADPAELDAELRHLLAVIQPWAGGAE